MSDLGSNPSAYGASVACIVIGLVVLLYGEYAGFGFSAVLAGGAVALVGVAVLTAAVAALPEPADGMDH